MSLRKTHKSLWWLTKRFVFQILVRTSNTLFGREIVHRSRLAKNINGVWLWLIEHLSPVWRRQASFERSNPDAPWFVPEAIVFIEKYLRPEHVGFEWGCGRSTLWFARRSAHITSIEGRREWFDEVSRWIDREGLKDKVSLRLMEVTVEYDFPTAEIERYASPIDAVAERSLDFVVVDGHFREACLGHVANKLRPGGLLIIDNSEVVPAHLIDLLPLAGRRSWNNGIWETTIAYSE
jgi:hypothetical protein